MGQNMQVRRVLTLLWFITERRQNLKNEGLMIPVAIYSIKSNA
ncbi:hypothetical protein MNBD_GAMMA10-2380 [hydrothermal vent metagenome]|uniref:Uncharacterized protein n=1 Tax=hydrothermal vent metagenome TaxID=652676 RepID=A0A3B0YIW6_9ZZZZ